MSEKKLHGRELTQTIKDLKAHVQWKIDSLPELAKKTKLDADSITALETHLRDELDYLDSLPEGAFLKDVMENHFEQETLANQMITGKEDN